MISTATMSAYQWCWWCPLLVGCSIFQFLHFAVVNEVTTYYIDVSQLNEKCSCCIECTLSEQCFFECFVVMWRTQFKCVCVCHVSDIIFRWQNNNFLYLQRFQFRHIHNFIRVRPSTFLYFINWKSISDESKESENHLIISILCFWTNAFLLRLSHQLQINYRAFALLAISKQIQIVKEVEENK